MYCTNCGKQADDGAKFCGGCGKPLENDVQEVTQAVTEQQGQQEVAVEPQEQQQVAYEPQPQQQQTGGVMIGNNYESTLRQVVGEKSDYYIDQFRRIERGEKGKFNPRWLVMGIWMPYRRIYKEMAFTLIPIFGQIYWFYLYIKGFFNLEGLYYDSIKRRLEKNNLTGVDYNTCPPGIQERFRKLSGTSIGSVVGYFCITGAIYMAWVFLIFTMMFGILLGSVDTTQPIPTPSTTVTDNTTTPDTELDEITVGTEEDTVIKEDIATPKVVEQEDNAEQDVVGDYLTNEEILSLVNMAYNTLYDVQIGYDYDKVSIVNGYMPLKGAFNTYDKMADYLTDYWSTDSVPAIVQEMSYMLVDVAGEYYLGIGDPPMTPNFNEALVIEVQEFENSKYVLIEAPSPYGGELTPYELYLSKEADGWKLRHEYADYTTVDDLIAIEKRTADGSVIHEPSTSMLTIECPSCLTVDGILELGKDDNGYTVEFYCLTCADDSIVWHTSEQAFNKEALAHVFSKNTMEVYFGGRGDGMCSWCGSGTLFSVYQQNHYASACLRCGIQDQGNVN